jgi:hypothetical protein
MLESRSATAAVLAAAAPSSGVSTPSSLIGIGIGATADLWAAAINVGSPGPSVNGSVSSMSIANFDRPTAAVPAKSKVEDSDAQMANALADEFEDVFKMDAANNALMHIVPTWRPPTSEGRHSRCDPTVLILFREAPAGTTSIPPPQILSLNRENLECSSLVEAYGLRASGIRYRRGEATLPRWQRHIFDFVSVDGEPTGDSVESFVDYGTGKVARVAIVRADGSSHAFDDPEKRASQLRQVREEMCNDPERGFSSLDEVCVGSAFAELAVQPGVQHKIRETWTNTSEALRKMSEVVYDLTEMHCAREVNAVARRIPGADEPRHFERHDEFRRWRV